MTMLKGAPKLSSAIGKTHTIKPITVGEFCGHFRSDTYVFVCAQSGGLFCGTIKDLKRYASLIDDVYRMKAETIHYNLIQELKRLEAIEDIDAELRKARIRLQQLEIDLIEAQREEAEAEKSGKLIEKTKEIVSSIEYSIRGVNGRIKMLTNAPRRIEFLRAYKAAHPRPDYQKPILDLITSEFRSRWLAPDEPPMWMIVTDSNQNGDVWLLSEMPELLKEYRGEE